MSSGAMRLGALVALLIAVSIPPLVVLQRPTSSPEPYVFEARLTARLGASTNQQLTYFEASTLAGTSPAEKVVASLDSSYTRGWDPAKVGIGGEYWLEGSLMTPEVFYGDQYIFYGPPQLYIRQLKTGALWPDQKSELQALYLSPLTTLVSPIQLPMLHWSDGVSRKMTVVLSMRCILLLGTVVWIARRPHSRDTVLLAVAIYALAAIALALPLLGDMY